MRGHVDIIGMYLSQHLLTDMFFVGLSPTNKFNLARCENISQFVKLLKVVIDDRSDCDSTCIVRLHNYSLL